MVVQLLFRRVLLLEANTEYIYILSFSFTNSSENLKKERLEKERVGKERKKERKKGEKRKKEKRKKVGSRKKERKKKAFTCCINFMSVQILPNIFFNPKHILDLFTDLILESHEGKNKEKWV